MPMYRYQYIPTKEEIEVLRKFDEYTQIPTEQELGEDGWDIEDGHREESNWQRILGTPKIVKGDGWGAGKGRW